MTPRAGSLVLLVCLTGCPAVGPDYRPPAPPVAGEWSEPLLGGVTAAEASVVRWWTTFDDPMLDSLITRAVGSNQDVQIATARVREARALRGITAGELLPTIDATASLTDNRRSRNSLTFPVDTLDSDLYEAGFDATWEIDLFGGKRRAVEAATAELRAAIEDWRAVLVTLLAEVARNYVEARSFQRRVAITEQNIAAQRDALDIIRARFDAGLSSELDVSRSAALLATTASQAPALESSLQRAVHRLGVLLGAGPGALLDDLRQQAPVPTPPPQVPVGLPSDLLRRRPDIRRSERQLAAATARIGVATADLFPKFALTGTAGLQSLSTGDLFGSGSEFWTAGPAFTWRLFDGGRIRANIRVQNERQRQALAEYEKTVLTSLEEVENALVAYAKEQVRHRALQEAVTANRRALDLASELYLRGLVDFLNVLDVQRALYLDEDLAAQSEGAVAANLVALYKALGGGWEAPAEAAGDVPAARSSS
jgi:NodT family efflux transporter outer membrane factor (OMF) lipoprotein